MTATSELVTVVIPAYNAGLYIAEAVESCLAQTHSNLEVIVVDDGSPGSQEECLRHLCDPRVRVIRQSNAGPGAARNRGVREGRGPIIAFLDADDAWEPTKLHKQLTTMRSTGAAVVCSDLQIVGAAQRLPRTYMTGMDQGNRTCVEEIIRRNFVALSSAVIHREVFESIGGFCEDRDIWEDWDLWLRVARAHQIACVSEVLGSYRLHDSNSSGNVEVLARRSLRTLERLEVAQPSLFASHARALAYGRANLWFNLGYARLREGRVGEAQQALLRAARLRPFHVGTWKDLLRSAIAPLRPNVPNAA